MVKVFYYGYILVTIKGIAFTFYPQLPKDLSNTFLGFFCKKKYVFIVNLGVLDLEFFTIFWVFLQVEVFVSACNLEITLALDNNNNHIY